MAVWSAGSLIEGRYRLAEVLGRGGMATVWRAHDTRLGRDVAVKAIPTPTGVGPAEDRARARAMREAHAAARITHPAAVAVFDAVDAGDSVLIVMELVRAPTLAAVVHERGALTPAATAEVGARLCAALDAAHRVGVIHRDVKPANVLLPDGSASAKLADFGIASLGDDPRLTATGFVVGSPSYMAPEQAQGGPLTDATDRWALGATLYFAVEGVPHPRPAPRHRQRRDHDAARR